MNFSINQALNSPLDIIGAIIGLLLASAIGITVSQVSLLFTSGSIISKLVIIIGSSIIGLFFGAYFISCSFKESTNLFSLIFRPLACWSAFGAIVGIGTGMVLGAVVVGELVIVFIDHNLNEQGMAVFYSLLGSPILIVLATILGVIIGTFYGVIFGLLMTVIVWLDRLISSWLPS